MARKVSILLTDDLSTDETPADETITFALDGTSYEIDLSNKNATAMREALSRYVGAARRAGKQASSSHTTRRATSGGRGNADRQRTQEIRAWAEAAGLMPEGRKGRIPNGIVEQYENRAKGTQTAMPSPEPAREPGEVARAELITGGAGFDAPEKVNGKSTEPKKSSAPKKDTAKEAVTA